MPFRYGLNQAASEPWLPAIGKLIVNFASVEAQTYLWLVQLHETVPLPARDNKLAFSPRVTRILELSALHAETAPRLQAIKDAWEVAKELSGFRNQIAHNPIVFHCSGKEEGPPDFVVVLDFKLGGTPGHGDATISLAQLNGKINATVEAAQQLFALYREIWPEAPESL